MTRILYPKGLYFNFFNQNKRYWPNMLTHTHMQFIKEYGLDLLHLESVMKLLFCQLSYTNKIDWLNDMQTWM